MVFPTASTNRSSERILGDMSEKAALSRTLAPDCEPTGRHLAARDDESRGAFRGYEAVSERAREALADDVHARDEIAFDAVHVQEMPREIGEPSSERTT